MTYLTIVELEEGALSITAAKHDGRKGEVLRAVRLPLADLGRDSVAKALRGADGALFEGSKGVHVVLGDRRVQHFVTTAPQLTPADTTAFVVREALRLTGMPAAADVLVSTRLLRTLAGKRIVAAATALARNVWEPIQEAFRQAGIEVLSLHSMESCLALAATAAQPSTGKQTAVVELNSGRARFVLCDSNAPVRVRRFLVGGGNEAGAEAFSGQLMMELPRTIEWLRETGCPVPHRLVLGTRVAIDDATIAMIRGDLESVERALVTTSVATSQANPGLGVMKLIECLGAGTEPPSLLQPPRLSLPWGATRWASLIGTAAAGFACTFSAVTDLQSTTEVRLQVTQSAQQHMELQQQLGEIQSTFALPPDTTATEASLRSALSMRRPLSRLLAEISNSTNAQLRLEELRFASTERIIVSGLIDSQTRKEALDAFADFTHLIHGLPYLEEAGQEEINEVAGQPGRFRFRLSLAWRNS